MKANYWDMQKIANWNKVRFQKNYITKQRRKVEEEISEFNKAYGKPKQRLEELADVYIAFAGLSRFSSIGAFVCKLFEKMPDYEILQKAVDNKMEINIRRKFNKNMHHITELETVEKQNILNEDEEYITVKKVFHNWKKGDDGRWHIVDEPCEFEVLKSEYYKGE